MGALHLDRGGSLRAVALTVLALGLLLTAASIGAGGAAAQSEGPVHVASVTGEIDLGLAPYLERAVRTASDDGAAALVVVIDTPGGRLDAVLQMRDTLLDSPVRTIAYVDRTALSAGALVALASEEIHLAPGAVMGAATPVDGTGLPADEKVVSAVRSTFEATAEQRGRDPLIAEAMVDPVVEVEGLVASGSLLTLTDTEALEVGYAEGTAASLPALLDDLGLGDRPVVDTDPSLAERLVRAITNPVVASLLLSIGVLLLLGDLLSGGIGVGVVAGGTLLASFFWGHLLAGLTGWEDVALVLVGVALILLEILVVPGFGIPGVLGLAAVLGGSFLATLNRDFDFVGTDQLVRSGLAVATSFVLIVGGLIGFLTVMSRRRGGTGVVLRAGGEPVGGPDDDVVPGRPASSRQPRGWLRWFGDGSVLEPDDDEGFERTDPSPTEDDTHLLDTRGEVAGDAAAAAAERAVHVARVRGHHRGPLHGATGMAVSDLRPVGVATISGERLDVVTQGEYIEAGAPVEVILDERYRRVVRRSTGDADPN